MQADKLEEHIRGAYFSLRIGIAVVSLLFPVILRFFGEQSVGGDSIGCSMSSYYYSNVRDVFVGILFAIGSFLYLYKGFSKKENILLNCAGVLAICVALFPTPNRCYEQELHAISVHAVAAVSFFICIALVCLFCADETLGLVLPIKRRNRYRRAYHVLGGAMILFPIAAIVAAKIFEVQRDQIFYIEAAGVWVFALYWCVKGFEMRETEADKHALRGNLVTKHTVAGKEAHVIGRPN
jgi:hypothetical protein